MGQSSKPINRVQFGVQSDSTKGVPEERKLRLLFTLQEIR